MNSTPCQAPRHDGTRCGRATGDISKNWRPYSLCILHTEDPAKNVGRFREELQTILNDSEAKCYDLSNVVFPEGEWISGSVVVDKPIIFKDAIFFGDVRFEQQFRQKADFRGAEFHGNVLFRIEKGPIQFADRASFDDVKFKQSVTFEGGFGGVATFFNAHFAGDFDMSHPIPNDSKRLISFSAARFKGNTRFNLQVFRPVDFVATSFHSSVDFKRNIFLRGADFEEAEFRGSVSFEHAYFGDTEKPNTGASFERAVFAEKTDFTEAKFRSESNFSHATFEKPTRVFFVDIDLSRVRFNRCDISSVQFSNVKWNRTKLKSFHANRNKVWDEVRVFQKDRARDETHFQDVAQTYRRLQVNYGESYRYPDAGDFYIGEQEMARQGKGEIRRYFCTGYLYNLVSYYGQRFPLPLGWLILTLFLFPLILSFTGLTVGETTNSQGHYIDFDWSWNSDDLLLLQGDYWKAFNANIDLISFRKGSVEGCLRFTWQRLLIKFEFVIVATLITFFLLALRRRFKRKSF